MKAIAPVLALHHRIVSFAQDRRGVSAVEFAMLLPLMVTLYLGTVEISHLEDHRIRGISCLPLIV